MSAVPRPAVLAFQNYSKHASVRMPEEWRDSVLIPIFKNKGDAQSCSNYRGIKSISHTTKLWERIVERRLRSDLRFSEQQYGVMPGKSTTGSIQFRFNSK